MTVSDVVDRLCAFRAAAIEPLPAAPVGTPSAIVGTPAALGWATVELDRAVRELSDALGIPPERFVAAADSRALGARCRVADAALPDGAALVVLEPATEGRLAATLARVGEGPAAIWLAVADLVSARDVARAAGIATSAEGDGPLGAEWLILGGPIHGPHRLVVGAPGTIQG
ncbi:MAG: hypothetical protein WEE50_11550 [Chloroflexota bacterium]